MARCRAGVARSDGDTSKITRISRPRYLDSPCASFSSTAGERLKAELSSSRRTSAPSAKDAGTQLSAIWRAMPLKPAALTTAGQRTASIAGELAVRAGAGALDAG